MPERIKSVSEARQQLPGLSKTAQSRMDRYVITQHGQPQSVLVGYNDYQSMKAAVELMQRPQVAEDIRSGLAQLRQGERLSPAAAAARLRELKQAAEARGLAAELAQDTGLDANVITQVVELLVHKMVSDIASKREAAIPGVGVVKIPAPAQGRKRRPAKEAGSLELLEFEPSAAVAEALSEKR